MPGLVAGGLTAAAVLTWSDLSLGEVILWSAVPGFVAVVLLDVGVKEERTNQIQLTESPRVNSLPAALVCVICADAALLMGINAVCVCACF